MSIRLYQQHGESGSRLDVIGLMDVTRNEVFSRAVIANYGQSNHEYNAVNESTTACLHDAITRAGPDGQKDQSTERLERGIAICP